LYGFVFWTQQNLLVTKAQQSGTRYLNGLLGGMIARADDPAVSVNNRQPLGLPLDEVLDIVPRSMGHRPSVQDPALFLLESVMKRMIDHDAGIEDGSVSVGHEGTDGTGEPVENERGDEGDDGVVGECGEDSQVGSGDEFSLDLVSLVLPICKVEAMTGDQYLGKTMEGTTRRILTSSPGDDASFHAVQRLQRAFPRPVRLVQQEERDKHRRVRLDLDVGGDDDGVRSGFVVNLSREKFY
jgi:hypothetical protein